MPRRVLNAMSQNPFLVGGTDRFDTQLISETNGYVVSKVGAEGLHCAMISELGIGVATACHLILAAWTGTGAGADHPHFEPVLFDAWRRVPHRTFTAVLDAGYDGAQYTGSPAATWASAASSRPRSAARARAAARRAGGGGGT